MKKVHLLFIALILLMLVCPAIAEETDTTPPVLTVNIVPENGTVRIYGTATDASGIDRVEIKLDENSWRTADLSGNNYTLTENITTTGYHISQVRAFDRAGNPSTVDTKTFYAEKKTTATSNDISFYVRLSSLKLTTFNISHNIREMTYPQDFNIAFDIVNDDSVPHKVRYTIDINGEEFTEDVTVSAGRSKDVSEWYPSTVLSEGQNRIRISVMDWDSKEKIADKTLTLNLLSTAKPATTANNTTQTEIPDWFREVAQANGMIIPENTNQSVEVQQFKSRITQLEAEIQTLKNDQTPQPETEVKNEFLQKYGLYILIGVVVILLYLHQTGKFDGILKKKEDEPEKPAEKQPLEPE
ncbi:Ig-like domain-containing protein [Methanolapillus millepedarum]|uniref:Uncharacterized protein n=1 Tax=Methanolapillus millepedarum TaxID=3028296 RepID=A0AA97A3N4_9EURY|nr:hypothetical protein MsAc7_07050 [Methanosarcinaceae archaeon Ac7]